MKILNIAEKNALELIRAGQFDDLKKFYNQNQYQGLSFTGLKLDNNNFFLYQTAIVELNISYIDFSECEITDSFLPAILAMVHKFNIKQLNLSKNNQLTTIGFQYLFENLKEICSLTLQFNKISDALLEKFALQIIKSKKLMELDLKGNHITDKGLKILGHILNEKPSLTSLQINQNAITLDGMNAFIKQIASSNLISSDIPEMIASNDITQAYLTMRDKHMQTLIKSVSLKKKPSRKH